MPAPSDQIDPLIAPDEQPWEDPAPGPLVGGELQRTGANEFPTRRAGRSKSDHEDQDRIGSKGTHPSNPPPSDGVPGGAPAHPSKVGRVQERPESTTPQIPDHPDFFDRSGDTPRLRSFRAVFNDAETWALEFMEVGPGVKTW